MRSVKVFVLMLLFLNSFLSFGQNNEVIPKRNIDTLKKHPDLWYVDKAPPPIKKSVDSTAKKSSELKTEEVEEPNDFDFQLLLQILKYLFITALIVGVLYFIIKGDFSFNFKRKANDNVDEIITETTKIETEEQLQNISFESQIAAAEANQNYRLATRLYYLWLLRNLVERGLLKFHIDKTNQDYCNELKGKTYYLAFNNCTNYYNYIWFGEFIIDEQTYQKIATKFKTIIANTL